MTPPTTGDLSKGDFRHEPQRSISQWHQSSAHDSAEACERAKTETVAKMSRLADQISDAATRQNAHVMTLLASMYYRCLPASQVPVR